MTHYLVLLVLLECFCYLSAQFAESPCPQYFEYVNDGSAVYGMIRLWPDGNQVSSLMLQVNFTIAAPLQTSYIGRLEPLGNDLLLIKYNAGQPISFRVHFPVTSTIPKLTALTVNEKYICGGPGDVTVAGSYVTTISLQSLLYLKANGISATFNPSFSSKPTDSKKDFINSYKNKQPKPGQMDIYNIPGNSNSFSNRPQIIFENPTYQTLYETPQKPDVTVEGIFHFPQKHNAQGQPAQQPSQNYPFQQNYTTQQNSIQTYPTQQYPSQIYPTPQDAAQNYPTQQISTQNLSNQQNPTKQYPTQMYPNQQDPTQNYLTQQIPTQNYPTQPNDTQNHSLQVSTQRYPIRPNVHNSQDMLKPVPTQKIPKPTKVPETTTEIEFNLDERFPDTSTTTPRPLHSSPSPIKCGVTATGNEKIPLIYKGDSFAKGDWPWLVAIYKKKDAGLTFACSGTLVSDRHVITAAHCMHTKTTFSSLRDMVVKVGVYNPDDWGDDVTVTRTLASAVIHESYNSTTLANDILVAMFDKRIQFNDYIRPACLWAGSTDLSHIVGTTGIVAGWGQSEALGAGHGAPRAVALPIVSTSTCRASRPDFHKLTSAYTLCAGDRNGAGPCLGDSGGGLYIKEGGLWRLRGVVSLSLRSESNSCNLNEYVVFTDAAQYLAWIQYVMNT